MDNPTVLFDVWEGSLGIDEEILEQNNIRGLIVRINDMNGGHHLDENFWSQYNQSLNAGLVTGIYFVYNPWVNGQANFDWLWANIPATARSVFVDIEVQYSGITPLKYAQEVRKFIDLCLLHWNTAIYTGEWFTSYLSYWPTDVPYWWAQYPSSMYPSSTQYWTYDKLYSTLKTLNKPYNLNAVPGPLLMWQCSGDRIILDGTSRAVDINVFFGTPEDLASWVSGGEIIPPTDVLVKEETWYDGCRYQQWDVTTNHGVIHTHLLTLDTNSVQEFFVTPAPDARHYVPAWLEEFPDMHIAINCDQFVGITMGGYNVSHGQPYGPIGAEDTVYIDMLNNFSLNIPPVTLWNAYSVPNVLARNGVTLDHIYDINATKGHRPRTATGISRYNDKKYILIVDGDETYNINTESGFDFIETSEFLLRHGSYEAYMSDGGGSTTLSKRKDDGTVFVVNAARGEDYQAKWDAYLRRVANCLMVKMKGPPLPSKTVKGVLNVEGFNSSEVTLTM